MAGLRDVVSGLASRPGVDAVVVVSADGLPIAHQARNGVDVDAVAALTASLSQGARRLGRAAHCNELTTGVLEYGDRLAVFAALGAENLLFVLVAPRTNIGPLLYDLRRYGPDLAGVL